MRLADVVKRQHYKREKQDRRDGTDPIGVSDQNAVLIRRRGIPHHLQRAEMAEKKLRPAIHIVISRPAMKNSSAVVVNRRKYTPRPNTRAKYKTMMTRSTGLSDRRAFAAWRKHANVITRCPRSPAPAVEARGRVPGQSSLWAALSDKVPSAQPALSCG